MTPRNLDSQNPSQLAGTSIRSSLYSLTIFIQHSHYYFFLFFFSLHLRCFSGSTCQPSTWRVTLVLLLMVCVCTCVYKGRDQELGDLQLYTVSHTLRSMWALGGSLSSYMCTLNVLYIHSSLYGGTAMASRCPSIFREHTLTGELPSLHEGRCPSLMLTTFLAINLTHKWDQTTATCTKIGEEATRTCTCNPTPDRSYARVGRHSPTSWGEALPLSFSIHPQDQVLHHVEETVPLFFPPFSLSAVRISEQQWRAIRQARFSGPPQRETTKSSS